MKKFVKYGILGLLGIIIIYVIYGVISSANAPKQVTATKPTRGNIEVTITANGKVQSIDTVELNFNATGKISYMPFKEGDTVKKGTVLAYLDGTDVKEKSNKAWADYRGSLESLREFENGYKDKPHDNLYLMQKGQKEAARDALSAIVAQNLLGYKDKTLVSPINGTITTINNQVGETPSAALPVIIVQDTGKIEFVAEVDEQDIGVVAASQSAEITLDAYSDRTIAGDVVRIESVSKTGTTGNTYFPVHIEVLAADKPLLVGMNGDASIKTTEKNNIVIIPQDVLLEEEEKTFVYIMENGMAKKKFIKTGLENDTEVEVTQGLSESDTIISSELTTIKDGTKVAVKESK
jgi:multidrug efflux pump subunit AcrA (membrane-fusion protein)